jgi:5-methylcytosine-specific restriction endonuclease McrA
VAEGSSRGSEWNELRLRVLRRDAYTCVYCGREATEADHVIPKDKGGQDTMTNLVASCKTCNASKGNRLNVRTNWFDSDWLDSL